MEREIWDMPNFNEEILKDENPADVFQKGDWAWKQGKYDDAKKN